MKKYKYIIWDFNGTIIDDVNAALGAVNDMLTKRNQNIISLDTYYSAIDIPIWKFYERVFIPGTITPAEAIAEYASGYDKHLSCDPLMDGVAETLEALRKLGKHQIVVSASQVDKVKSQLRDLDVLSYFDAVLAQSDFNAGDKTYLAREYFRAKDYDFSDAVIIGDSVFDYHLASEVGCDCILTTRGHQSRREFAGVPARIIDNITELKDIIE